MNHRDADFTRPSELPELLVQAGAQLRGPKRADCPRCGGLRSISYTDEVFHCHKCAWAGNAITLAHELGLAISKPTPVEMREKQIIRREAERFAAWARTKRIGTACLLRDLDRYESDWCGIGQTELAGGSPVSEIVWDRLHLCFLWSERAEQVWRQLFNFESNAGELYREFSREREAA